ncbi:sugar kinase, partial [Micromonospora sp. NPDC049799]
MSRPDSPAGAVRQASLRELNLALVLGRIAAADRPPSRADLAAETGLTRATVSSGLGRRQRAGGADRRRRSPGPRGRPDALG